MNQLIFKATTGFGRELFGLLMVDLLISCYIFQSGLPAKYVLIFLFVILGLLYFCKKYKVLKFYSDQVLVFTPLLDRHVTINYNDIERVDYKFLKSNGMCLIIRFKSHLKYSKIIFPYSEKEMKLLHFLKSVGVDIYGYRFV
jgi:hypothetical protein